MNETQSYLQMMIESLRKKDGVLSKIIEKNEAQAECVADNEYGGIDWDRFNVLVAEKETLINRITEMDQGFQSLFDRVEAEVKANREKYRDELATLQELISLLTDKGVEIRTQEERNRAKIERVLMGAKKEIRKSRKSMKAVTSYYKSMSNPDGDTSGTMDKKK